MKRVMYGCTAAILVSLVVAGCSVNAVGDKIEDEIGVGCEEWTGKGEIDARVDAKVRMYMEATREVDSASARLKVSVRDACANIARDLGCEDTWSKLGDTDEAVSNACDQAKVKIEAIMTANASANFALVKTPGVCHRDFEAQAACETQCKAQQICEVGTCEERCEPAQLSVKCEGKCKASAHCEGSAKLEANCMGVCESTCVGECKGTCIKADGSVTENDPNCNGKCSASCNGKCKGICKVEAEGGIECGAEVRCTGGCEGTYTEPKCVKEFTPPRCSQDETCLASCEAKADAKQVCEPSTVELYADVKVNVEVEKLVATINANLPKIVAAAEAEGQVVLEAGNRISAKGEALAQGSVSLNAKTVSCATTASKSAAKSANSMKTSFNAAKSVTDTCKNHSK